MLDSTAIVFAVILLPMVPTYWWLGKFCSPRHYGTGWYLDLDDPNDRALRYAGSLFWPLGLITCILGTISANQRLRIRDKVK